MLRARRLVRLVTARVLCGAELALVLGAWACTREPARRGVEPAPAATAAEWPTPRPSADPWALPPAAVRTPLEAGASREERFASGAARAYRLHLDPGSYAQIRVEQKGVDVALRLTRDGQRLLEIDQAEGTRGREDVPLIGSGSGAYDVLVRPVGAPAGGTYQVDVTAPRAATAADRRRVAASALVAAADALCATQKAGDRQRAADLYERAAAEWKALGAAAEETYALRQWGRTRADQGAWRDALELFDRALETARRRDDRLAEARLLDESGPPHRRLGHHAEARARYQRALALARGLGDGWLEASVLNDLGVLAADTADPDGAVQLYQQALALWRPLARPRHEAMTAFNLAFAYTLLGRNDDAADLLETALRIHTDAGNVKGQASALLQIGWLRYLAHDDLGALASYGEGLRLADQLRDDALTGSLIDRRGSALLHLRRLDEALADYEQAMEIWRRLGDANSIAQTTSSLAALHAARGDWARAQRLYVEALDGLRALGDTDSAAQVLVDRARARIEREELQAARSDVDEALGLFEQLRRGVGVPASRASYLAVRHDAYTLAIELLMRSAEAQPDGGHAEAAFNAAERSRSRSLLDSLRARAARPLSAVRERDRELQTRINLEEEARGLLVRRGALSREIDEQKARVEALLREQEELRRPALRSLAGAAEPLDLAGVRRLLDPDTLLLAYALGEPRSFVWLVGPDGPLVTRMLAPRAQIEALVRQTHAALQDSRALGAEVQATLAARQLSDLLLRPLNGLLGRKRLMIVTDDILQYVPFGALPVVPSQPLSARPATRTPMNGGVPLLAEHEISYVPSASVLGWLRHMSSRREPAPRSVGVVADPVEPGDPRCTRCAAAAAPPPAFASTRDLARSLADVGAGRLGRLRFSRFEAERILALDRTGTARAALDFEANREFVRQGGLREFGIVHFAAHGLVDARHPQLSGILLSRVDSEGRPRDGFLRVHEIEQLDLRAALVVLSACRTALGQEVRGEGLVGLAQAFLQAGAARVLVSLWSIDDRATAELMGRFYDAHLVRGRTPAAALREAQMSMWSEPEYAAYANWAGFVLEGDW